jgi:predicted Zn-dependent protease
VAKANEPGDFSKGADMAESGLGFLGQRGFKQADDPKTKDAVALARSVAAIMDTVSRRRSLTQVDERLLGRACFTRVLGNVTPLAGDDAIVRYVNWIGDRVAAHSTNPFPAIALEFVVIPDYPANAIAIPGGPIVVSMGMLRELRSEDELAAVLGHAIAHVEERHGLGRAKSRGLESLRDPEQLAKPFSASSQQAAANAAKQMALSPEATAAVEREMQKEQVKLSKAMSSMLGSGGLDRIAQDVTDFAVHGDPACEPSADLRGMSLAAAAGYQPAALAAVIERFHAGHAAWEGIAGDARSRASMCREIADDLVMRTAPPPQASPASPHGTPTLPDEPQDRWKRLQDELAQRGW